MMLILYRNYVKNQGYSRQTHKRPKRIQWFYVSRGRTYFPYYKRTLFYNSSMNHLRILSPLDQYFYCKYDFISYVFPFDYYNNLVLIFLGWTYYIHSCTRKEMDSLLCLTITYNSWWPLTIYPLISCFSINKYLCYWK